MKLNLARDAVNYLSANRAILHNANAMARHFQQSNRPILNRDTMTVFAMNVYFTCLMS